MVTRTSGRPNAWTGWIAFAACTLIVLGVLNLFEGFTSIFRSGYYRTPSGELLVWNYTAWGGVMLAFGALQILIGFGLFTGKAWARWSAIFLVMLNIIAHIGFLVAFPFWSFILIGLDMAVLYALTARWNEAIGPAPGQGAMQRGQSDHWRVEETDRTTRPEEHPVGDGRDRGRQYPGQSR